MCLFLLCLSAVLFIWIISLEKGIQTYRIQGSFSTTKAPWLKVQCHESFDLRFLSFQHFYISTSTPILLSSVTPCWVSQRGVRLCAMLVSAESSSAEFSGFYRIRADWHSVELPISRIPPRKRKYLPILACKSGDKVCSIYEKLKCQQIPWQCPFK